MPPRARAMSPDERLDQLVETTLRLLREHGRGVTTRQIAEAAGVAEGTIFRVVDSKDALVEMAMKRAFQPGAMVERLAEIDTSLPLRDRLVVLCSVLQQRNRATFDLMKRVGMLRPPDHDSEAHQAWRATLTGLMVDLVGPDADRLAIPVLDFCHRLRLLTFAGSHPHIADGWLLTPEQVVDTLLFGLLTHDSEEPC